jgi:hypothetical protein
MDLMDYFNNSHCIILKKIQKILYDGLSQRTKLIFIQPIPDSRVYCVL